MTHMTEVEHHRAHKLHLCDWCWQTILPGDIYNRYRWFYYGEAGTIKLHPECYDAMCEEANEEGDMFEWTPGRDRPEITASSAESLPRQPIR